MQVIRDELIEARDQFGDERRTEIIADHLDLTMEDLITEEDVVVTLSHSGYAKSQPLSDYRAQRRGGRGRAATRVKEEDFIDKLFVASTHDTILCFSSRGKAYWLKVYQLPQAGRAARGKPIVNLLPLEEGERINAVLPVREFREDRFVFMATAQGTVKKTPLADFSRPRSNGIIALDLRPDDYLVNIALIILEGGSVLTATENGYGKRTPAEDYPIHGRGGQGVISIQTPERNGEVVGAVLVQDDDEIMMITNAGTLVRTRVNEISTMSRNTQGVRLISLQNGEKLVGIERIVDVQESVEGEDLGTPEGHDDPAG
jgi:DNA gyrase subunit A